MLPIVNFFPVSFMALFISRARLFMQKMIS
jgi:hypothetical protein